MVNKKKTLFDVMNDIFYKRNVKYDKKIANAWILSLWLSHDPKLITIVNEINQFIGKIPDELVYQYFMDKIPKGKRYVKWIKKDKEDKRKKLIEELSKRNDCSVLEMEKTLI